MHWGALAEEAAHSLHGPVSPKTNLGLCLLATLPHKGARFGFDSLRFDPPTSTGLTPLLDQTIKTMVNTTHGLIPKHVTDRIILASTQMLSDNYLLLLYDPAGQYFT